MRTKTKNDVQFYHRHRVNDAGLANQSLKLTEITARDFAARREFTKGQNKTQ